ncbi:MAG: carboxypeptidase regulatory-like domain-containing protein [Acidimicrobiia bacterium]|nr:carboxypeptidase regulatory-like domain-containing protein [Acidimicrobiia bacterium]
MSSLGRIAFAVFLSLPGLTFAQSGAGTASIQGTVRDTTGAPIAGAQIEAEHIATSRVSKTETNETGFYATPPIAMGRYKVRVSLTGMKTWESELNLETGSIAVVNADLMPGAVTETITVSETIPLVSTTTPTSSSTLDAQRIQEIPVNGRSLNTLLEGTVPGVEALGDVNGGVRVAGLMVYSTDYVQDGASTNNREFGGSGSLQGLESIGEVRVETSTSSGKYTRPTSVIITTKSGTNQLRFTLFETHRNNSFGVAKARQDVFLDGRDFRTPKLIRNEFGGSVGGPVLLPSFGLNGKRFYDGRKRTFFFFTQEQREAVQGLTREFRVPTAAMRRGDFSALTDAQGRSILLYDPMTTRIEEFPNGREVSVRDRFVNNQIPIERMSPFARHIYSVTPMPTDITNPVVANNLKIVVPTTGAANLSENPTVLKIDHRFTDNDNVVFKLNRGNLTTHFIGTGGNTGAPTLDLAANTTFLSVTGQAVAITWVRTFSPSFNVETLINRSWQFSRTVTGPKDVNWSKELGLPNPYGEIGWPAITNSGFMNYVEGDNRRQLYSMVSNVQQNYSLIRGRHNFGFGFSFHDEKQHLLPDQGAISGATQYNSLATALESSTLGTNIAPGITPQTGHDAAHFFLGVASRYEVGLKRGIMRVQDRNYGLYFEDQWKLTPRLTITPTVRWDINPAFSEKSSLLTAFDRDSHSLMLPKPLEHYYRIGVTNPQIVSLYENVGVSFKTAEELGKPRQLFPSSLYDIGPRGGFAYQLTRGDRPWIIRGGYGVYISAVPMRTLLAQFSSLPPFRVTFARNFNDANQSPDGIPNFLLRNVPTVIAGQNSANAVDLNSPSTIGRGVSVIGFGGRQPSMKIHEWNLLIEKQLAPSTVVRLTYKGKHGVNSDQLYNINGQPNNYVWHLTTGLNVPTGEFASVLRRPYDQNAYTDVRILQRSGYINTSIWSLEAERRLRSGLGFQVFYTLTNSLRLAGNSFRDDQLNPGAYLPGTVPTEFHALNRFLFYDRDTAVPKHRIRWNWSYDLPFGRGKWFGRNSKGLLNNLMGGWRLIGNGTIMNTWYSMPTGNWGDMGNFETYGKKHKILDCRQTPLLSTNFADERCVEGYLWYNGYISERFINSRNPGGLRNGVFGLPANYKPAQRPINPWPAGGQPTDLNANDYDTNMVYLPLLTGGVVRVGYDTGLHPWRNQHMLGPFNWTLDSSLKKTFQITESRVRLQLSVDVFNVFNVQGLNVPNSEGIVSLSDSFNRQGFRPRQVQLLGRLEF